MKDECNSIWLLCINDLHAVMEENAGIPGCAKLVSGIGEFCNLHKNVKILFGGDNYKGDPVSEYLKGKPVSDLMRMLDVQASVLGNHDFDQGTEMIKQWQKDGGYQFLACNLIEKRTGEIPEFVAPYIILDVMGIKILVVGVALPERLDTADRPEEMREFLILDRENTISKIRHILEDVGSTVHAAVALTHYGLRYRKNTDLPEGDETMELCEKIPELDGVFTAHLHNFMALRVNGIAVAQGGSKSQGFAYIRLDFDENNHLLCAEPGFQDLRKIQDKLVSNEKVQQMWAKYKNDAMNYLGKPLAILPYPVVHRNSDFEVDPEGTPLSHMATRLMCEETGCEISLFYSGRIGVGLEAGELTLYEAYQTLFFKNQIVTMELTGKVIRENIETGLRTLEGEGASPIAVGGLIVEADFSLPYGNRIMSVSFPDGSPLELDRKYRIAVDEYLADNSMNFDFASAESKCSTGIYLRDSMIRQIEQDGTIDISYENRNAECFGRVKQCR